MYIHTYLPTQLPKHFRLIEKAIFIPFYPLLPVIDALVNQWTFRYVVQFVAHQCLLLGHILLENLETCIGNYKPQYLANFKLKDRCRLLAN